MSSHTAREDLVTPGPIAPGSRGFTLPSAGELLAGGRGVRAIGSAAALFVILLFFLFARPLSLMPGYPAVMLAFVVWAIAPGWLLQRALFSSRDAGLVKRVAMAFLLSMGLVAVPGVIALRLHWNLETLGVAYALVAAIAGGGVLLFERDETGVIEQPARSSIATGPLLALIALPLLAIASSPWWTDTIARDSDDWVYMAYVNHYVHHDLDPSAPQAGLGSYQRMRTNVWVIEEALIADSSDVQPHDLLLSYLPPILTLMAAAATFALAKGLSGRSSLGVLAVAFLLGYAVLDLSPHEGFGRNLFLRIGEDKMVASFVMLPIALLLSTRFIAKPKPAWYIASLLAGIALFAVHPMSLLFFGIAAAAFTALRAAAERSPKTLVAGAALLVPLVALGGLSLGYLAEASQPVATAFDPRLFFRDQFHVNSVGHGLTMGDFHLILHPLVLVSLVAAPLVWLRARREASSQLVFAIAGAVILIFFAPPLTTLLGKGFSWNAAWRLPWMLPVALTLALASEAAFELVPRLHAMSARMRSAALVAGVIAVLAVALVAQEYYDVADGGAFYNRTSTRALLPGTSSSIVLGGVDRAFSSDWRLPARVDRLNAYLNEHALPGATLLADPSLSLYFPGLTDRFEALGALNRATQVQANAIAAFYAGEFTGAGEARNLGRIQGADYAILQKGTRASDSVQQLAVYVAGQFTARGGAPTLADLGPAGATFPAWTLGPNTNERLVAKDSLIIPDDILASDRTLDFELLLTTLKDVQQTSHARLVVSFYRVVPQGQKPTVVNVVYKATIAKGMLAYAPIRALRMPGTNLVPGAKYNLSVSRLGNDPLDTYTGDLAFANLVVRYKPTGLHQVPGTPLYLFDISAAALKHTREEPPLAPVSAVPTSSP